MGDQCIHREGDPLELLEHGPGGDLVHRLAGGVQAHPPGAGQQPGGAVEVERGVRVALLAHLDAGGKLAVDFHVRRRHEIETRILLERRERGKPHDVGLFAQLAESLLGKLHDSAAGRLPALVAVDDQQHQHLLLAFANVHK